MKVTFEGGPLNGRTIEYDSQEDVPDYLDDWGGDRDTADGHWEWFGLETSERTGYKFMDLTWPDDEHGQFRHASRHASKKYRRKGLELKDGRESEKCPADQRARFEAMAAEQRERLTGVA